MWRSRPRLPLQAGRLHHNSRGGMNYARRMIAIIKVFFQMFGCGDWLIDSRGKRLSNEIGAIRAPKKVDRLEPGFTGRNSMTHSRKLLALLPLAAAAFVLLSAGVAQAWWLDDWFGWNKPTTVTAGYAYVPVTSYRTFYAPAAVTSYLPAPACGTCGACGACGATTSYMPVTAVVQRPIIQTYTSYRVVSAPACGTCATAYYAPAPACGCASCGCGSCGCAAGGCATGGCASCGYAPAACPTCGGPVGGTVAIGGPSYPGAPTSPGMMAYSAPTIMSPVTSTPYLPSATTAYSSGPMPVYAAAPPANYPIPATTTPPTYTAVPSTPLSPTYAMPVSPNVPPANAPAVNCPPGAAAQGNSVVQPGSPTLAPPPGGSGSADVAPSLPGPVPATNSPSNSTQPTSPKTFETPTTPATPAQKPIPDTQGPTAPKSSNSQRPLDPNSRTAYTIPMMRLGSRSSTPWPIAKTTAALMPVEATPTADADGWHEVK